MNRLEPGERKRQINKLAVHVNMVGGRRGGGGGLHKCKRRPLPSLLKSNNFGK